MSDGAGRASGSLATALDPLATERRRNEHAPRQNDRATVSVNGRTDDLLTQAIERVSPMLADAGKPTKERIHLLWAAAKAARDLASSDVVHETFVTLAITANLIDGKGRWTGADVAEHRRAFGAQDVEHVIRWALRRWNPFETGPLI
jgi:hypothetical protein